MRRPSQAGHVKRSGTRILRAAIPRSAEKGRTGRRHVRRHAGELAEVLREHPGQAAGLFSTDEKLAEQLKRARERLLDLTNRNRLINTPLERSRSRRLDIVDELSREVFRILVCERQEMSFLPSLRTLEQTGVNCVTDPGQTSGDGLPHLAQPDEGDEPEAEISERHSDRYLQTSLDDEALQDRLLKLHNEARTRIEDQGFNSLFLAMGFLKWFESPNSD
ncbi:MAG: DUF4011 domain-containing protein, partial [Alicyclobacillus sp.]|nr:DUF4011 domain-containing protein [Alicyclobacillus sp.]